MGVGMEKVLQIFMTALCFLLLFNCFRRVVIYMQASSSFEVEKNCANGESVSRVLTQSKLADELAANGGDPFEAKELELIENALQTLQQRGRLTDEANGVDGEIAQPGPSTSNQSQDADGIDRLLKKVQAVRARALDLPEGETSKTNNDRNLETPGSEEEDMDPAADIRQMVQAASKAAIAAAKAAEAMVSSVNRNSQALENLCKRLTSSSSEQATVDEGGGQAEGGGDGDADGDARSSDEDDILEMELQQMEIAKSLIRQNRVTHWVLGVIFVSSLVWRLGVIQVVQKVNNRIQNPFQGITNMFKGSRKQERGHQAQKGPNLPKLKLPGINDDDSDDVEREPQKAHRSQSAGVKENGSFKLGNILPIREPDPKSKHS